MFRHYRESNNLSFRQMETLTGVSKAQLYRFEAGKSLDQFAFSELVKFIVSPHDTASDATLLNGAKAERAKVKAA
jgi:transcriptional regulator with XRE-family HTH domain